MSDKQLEVRTSYVLASRSRFTDFIFIDQYSKEFLKAILYLFYLFYNCPGRQEVNYSHFIDKGDIRVTD